MGIQRGLKCDHSGHKVVQFQQYLSRSRHCILREILLPCDKKPSCVENIPRYLHKLNTTEITILLNFKFLPLYLGKLAYLAMLFILQALHTAGKYHFVRLMTEITLNSMVLILCRCLKYLRRMQSSEEWCHFAECKYSINKERYKHSTSSPWPSEANLPREVSHLLATAWHRGGLQGGPLQSPWSLACSGTTLLSPDPPLCFLPFHVTRPSLQQPTYCLQTASSSGTASVGSLLPLGG